MGKFNQPTSKQFDEQELANWEHDHSLKVKKVMPYEQDGFTALAPVSKLTAKKITTSGTSIYVATAKIGSSQASAVWQVKKIDTSSGVVITWADANANFDNVATDLTTLTYS